MRKSILFFVLFLFAASSSLAQDAPFQLTPWAGYYIPAGESADLEAVLDSGLVAAKLTGSPVFGLDLEWYPTAIVGIRGEVSFVYPSSLTFQNWDGIIQRGDARISYSDPQGLGISMLNLSGNIVIQPGGDETMLPYLVVGAGMKRYSFKGADLAPEFENAFSSDNVRGSFRISLGININRLRAEITDHISTHNFVFTIPDFKRAAEPKTRQHDIFVKIGFRIGSS